MPITVYSEEKTLISAYYFTTIGINCLITDSRKVVSAEEKTLISAYYFTTIGN